MTILKIATYNIHKGFSQFNRRMVLHELRERLRELDADIMFLQEVQGEHDRHGLKHANYPAGPQYEFLADEFWGHHAYGMNAVYKKGHHGNAILSRFPILKSRNKDVSAHRFEQRGLLHTEIDLSGQLMEREGGGEATGNPPAYPLRVEREGGGEATGNPPAYPLRVEREGGGQAAGNPPAYPLRVEREGGGQAAGNPPAYPLRVHCVCAHFGLFSKGRREQVNSLIEHVLAEVPPNAPLIIAGDFNDWRNQLSRTLASELGVQDVFDLHAGKPARSFPARFPLFRLDRIYVRGFSVQQCDVHIGGKWQRLSDHAALSAQLERS